MLFVQGEYFMTDWQRNKFMQVVLLFLFIFNAAAPAFAGQESITKRVSSQSVLEQLENAFVDVALQVEPAVVNISAERTIKTRAIPFPGSEEELRGTPFEDFFKFFKGNPDRKEKLTSLGSGVIVRKDGYILTNAHVIKDASQITVILQNGDSLKVTKIIGMDEFTDLAIIKVAQPKKPLKEATLGNSDNIKVGSWAIAIGNPFGFSSTMTVGIISAKGRPLEADGGITYRDLIQTDASINPGNSGGPLVNVRGEVIGINTAIATTTGGSVGIGFAIPINLAKDVMRGLMTKGRVIRGWMGVIIKDLTEDIMKQTGLTRGVFIGDVYPDGPAFIAGLKSGDIIVEFEGKQVENVSDLQEWVQKTPVGRSAEIVIVRDKEKLKRIITIKERPAHPPKPVLNTEGAP